MTNARPVLLPATSSTGVSPSTLPAVECSGDDLSARVAIERDHERAALGVDLTARTST